MKRCSLAAGLLGCYLAGIVTMGLCWPGNRNVAVAENPLGATAGLSSSARNTGGQAIRGTQTNQQPQNAQPAAVPVPSGSAGQLVAARIPTAFESWRNIGDYYLQKTGDISLAVASYSEAINLATESERALSPERDTWLLMALKDSRGKDSRAMDSLEKEQNYVIPEPN
jgi:hypothetical protein